MHQIGGGVLNLCGLETVCSPCLMLLRGGIRPPLVPGTVSHHSGAGGKRYQKPYARGATSRTTDSDQDGEWEPNSGEICKRVAAVFLDHKVGLKAGWIHECARSGDHQNHDKRFKAHVEHLGHRQRDGKQLWRRW